MNRRRLSSAAALVFATTLLLAPAARAVEGTRGERIEAAFLADPLALLGAWLGSLFGLEATTAASGCGEAGASIDPNGCPTAAAPGTGPASQSDAGPQIDPNGH